MKKSRRLCAAEKDDAPAHSLRRHASVHHVGETHRLDVRSTCSGRRRDLEAGGIDRRVRSVAGIDRDEGGGAESDACRAGLGEDCRELLRRGGMARELEGHRVADALALVEVEQRPAHVAVGIVDEIAA